MCELLQSCLESIYDTITGLKFEIIIVDNASQDKSAEMIKSRFSGVTLVENKINAGFAASNNQAMSIAKGRYYLLLNPDTRVLDNAIVKTIEFANEHANAAITVCKVLDADGTLQPNCFTYPSACNFFLLGTYLNKLFAKNRFFGRERLTWWGYDNIRSVEAVTGCFMLLRKEAVDQIGGLDERFFMYAEEMDWCYRFTRAGWKIMFTPDSAIIHYGHKSSDQLPAEMILQPGLSKLRFVQKHKGAMEYILSCFFLGLFYLLRIPYWMTIAILSEKKKKNALVKVKTYAVGVCRACEMTLKFSNKK